MSTDYAEKERDFIAGLAEDTGRDLADWMAAIAESGLNERNDIIDWLRHRGFQFSWASWLERIHHNRGRLIYADALEGAPTSNRQPSNSEMNDEPPSRDRPAHNWSVPPAVKLPASENIQNLLGEAKGLRPLAEHVLREIGRAVPSTEFAVTGPLVMMSAPNLFAALHPGPRKLRLYANLGAEGANRSKPAEAVNKSTPPFAQMLVLDDARSIDEDFRRLIRAAAAR